MKTTSLIAITASLLLSGAAYAGGDASYPGIIEHGGYVIGDAAYPSMTERGTAPYIIWWPDRNPKQNQVKRNPR